MLVLDYKTAQKKKLAQWVDLNNERVILRVISAQRAFHHISTGVFTANKW
jgi:hypothetical protein